MNLRDALSLTTAHFKAGNAVTWISPPGLGKTDSLNSLVRWMKQAYPTERLGMSTIFMATSSPIAFGGLPWKGTLKVGDKEYTVTDPAMPQWYVAIDVNTGEVRPADQFDRVMLVIEEWGQGDLETKRAGADLLLHGACGRFALPQGSFRIALSNADTRDGVTKEFDFVINRRAELHLTGDVDCWIEDFADKPQYDGRLVMPVTKVWAKSNSQILFEGKPKEQGPWCTPRSVTMWDRFAQEMAAQTKDGQVPVEDSGFVEASAGMIGMGAATSLINTCRFRLELPSLEDVVADPAGCEVPTKPDLMMLMMYELAARAKPDQLPQVLQYVTRIKQQDMHITFVTAMLRRDYKSMIDQPAMKAWIAKNARLVSIISTLAA
jgi:hypothetical protein